MFTAGTEKFKQVLEERDKFILAFAVCEEQGKEDGKIACPKHDFLCYLFC